MDEIVRHSRELIEKGSKSFAGAARLFSPQVRDDAYMLYAWCRHCDDVIDGQDLGFAAPAADPKSIDDRLADLKAKTIAAVEGKADDPVFIALSRVVAKHDMDRRYPLDLLDGFAMDARGHVYSSLEDTVLYSYHVAGVVGVMMAIIMGARATPTLNRASDLGIAFQLTNISRDVIEDAESGRCYLPADWLGLEGVPPHSAHHLEHRDGVARVVARLLGQAEGYYDSARYGLAALPFRSAWAIAAALRIYREIGTAVHHQGAAAWDRRVVVSRSRKLSMLGSALFDAVQARTLGRAATPPSRDGLWTKPGLEA
jgi:phytoene synthase